MINPNDLLRKYQQLRAVQKEFFKNRDRNVLEKAKGLEIQLDGTRAWFGESDMWHGIFISYLVLVRKAGMTPEDLQRAVDEIRRMDVSTDPALESEHGKNITWGHE